MDSTCTVLIILVLIFLWVIIFYSQCNEPAFSLGDNGDDSGSTERLTGYGVISGLAFNNPISVCSPGNNRGWSGGCFVPSHVVV